MDTEKEKSRPIPEGSVRKPGQGSPEVRPTDRAEEEQQSVGLRPDLESLCREVAERERAEAALKRSERDYCHLFESAHDAILIFRPEDEVVLEVNQRACDLYGFGRSEFIGMSLEKITRDVQEGKAHIQATLDKRFYHHFETVHYRRDGTEMFVEINASTVNYKGRWAIQSINRDVTGRKRAEESLRALSKRQEALLDAVPNIIMEVDNNKVYTWANQAGLDFFGEDVIGKEAAFYFEGEQETYNVVQPLFDGQKDVIYVESWQRGKNGQKRLLGWWCRGLKDESGDVKGALSSAQDITDSWRAEEVLRESEQRLREAQAIGRIGHWEYDVGSRTIAWSDQTFDLYERDRALGAPTPEEEATYYSPEQSKILREYAARAIETGESFHYDLEAKLTSGRTAFFSAALRPLKDKNGRVLKLFGTIQDVTERKRAEEELREGKERLRQLVEAAPDVIYTISAEDGALTSLNPAFEKVTGWPRKEWLGKPFTSLVHPEDVPRAVETFKMALQGEKTPPYELRILSQTGEYLVGEFVSTPLIEGGKVVGEMGIARDITERKRAEAHFAYQAHLLDDLYDAVIAFDDHFVVKSWNKAAEELYGWKAEEVLGRTRQEVLHTEYIGTDRPQAIKILKEAGEFQGELIQQRRDGRRIVVESKSLALKDADGRTSGYVSVNRDITIRKQAEEALRESEEKYRLLVENSGQGVLVLQDGLLKFANPRAVEYSGYSEEELTSTPFLDLVHPDDRGMIAERYQKRLKGEDIPPIYQFRFPDKQGQVKWVEVNSALISWKGRPAALSFLSDINERKRAEEGLRESEEKYRLLLENAGDAILVAQEGKMRFVNPKAREYLGYSEQELTSRPFLEFIHPEDREMVMDRYLKRLRGEQVPQVYPFRIVSKGGKVRWVEIHAVVIAWQGAPATLNFLRDISDRKGAEEALRQSEALSRALIDHSPVGVSVRSRDGVLLQVNEAWKRIWAMSDQEIQEAEQGSAGRSFEERFPYLMEAAQDVRRIFSSEGSLSMLFLPELEVKDPRPGTPQWITQYFYALRNEQGQVERVVTLTQDITERKQAEENLRKLEQEKSLILSTVSEMVVYLDKGLRIAWANRAAGEEAGCTPEALVGRHCYEVWHGLSVLCENCPVAKAFQTGTTQEGEVTSPQERDWHIRAYPVLSDKGEVKGVVEVVREITERKLLEKELLQAQKMEAVGRLAGGVAHDFNNLLTSIMGYADLLAEKLKEDDPLRRYAEAILASANRATNLTQQLLSLSRRHAVQMQVLDPGALVAEVARMLRRLIGENIELTTLAEGALGRVKADPVQIEQVLMNLCINARDAMPRGGKLSIKTANVVLGGSYTRRHMEVTQGPYVMISVTDTGHGMDAEVQSHLFEPFFTTKEKGKGTGLGLSMAYGIVKQANGHIDVESASGRGSTFKIYLPRTEEPLASPRPEAAPAELPRGTETVLVAEDEEKVRALVREVLQGEGYTVLEAGDGEEALEVAGRHQGPVHLLVTDVIMPRLSGPRLVSRLRLVRPDIRVLYMSGYTDGEISSHGGLDREIPLLHKPFQPGALSRRVRDVLNAP